MKTMIRCLTLSVAALAVATATPIVRPIGPGGPVTVGSTFNIGVDIENAVFVNGYQFDLSFDPLVLEFVSLAEGTFLPFPLLGTPLFDPSELATGNVLAVANYMADTGVSGTGRLVNFVFKALTASPNTVVTATGGLYTSITDWNDPNAVQEEIQTQTIETTSFAVEAGGVVIPEPSSLLLAAAAAAAFTALRLRRR